MTGRRPAALGGQPRLRYDAGAGTVALWKPVDKSDPAAVFDLALAACDTLRVVIDPLAFGLWLGTAGDGSAEVRPRTSVPQLMWFLTLADLPDGVRPEPPPGRGFDIATTDELTSPVLRRWLAGALNQLVPDGPTLTWTTLVCADQRARLWTDSPTCVLELDPEVRPIRPVQHDGGGGWVAFPPPEHIVEPPVRVQITNHGDTLDLDLLLSWTPWAEPGTAEWDTIAQAVSALEPDGWRRHRPDRAEIIGFPPS